jgi:regulatory protein
MIIIESIIKVRTKIKVSFDNGTFLFLNENAVIKHNLYKSMQIPEEFLNILLREAKIIAAKESAYRCLSRRSLSVFELKTKLRKKDYEDNVIEEIIDELLDKKYLNDFDFASRLIQQKINAGSIGINRIRLLLQKRGINRELIKELLDANISEMENIKAAENVALKKYKILMYKNPDEMSLTVKLYNHLEKKGFSGELS